MVDLQNGLHGPAVLQAAVKASRTVQERAQILCQNIMGQIVLGTEHELEHAKSKTAVSLLPYRN